MKTMKNMRLRAHVSTKYCSGNFIWCSVGIYCKIFQFWKYLYVKGNIFQKHWLILPGIQLLRIDTDQNELKCFWQVYIPSLFNCSPKFWSISLVSFYLTKPLVSAFSMSFVYCHRQLLRAPNTNSLRFSTRTTAKYWAISPWHNFYISKWQPYTDINYG